MSETPDDIPKELLDLIQKLLRGGNSPNDLAGMPSIVGVKFVVGGTGIPDKFTRDSKKTIVLEVMEEMDHYVIQTELPGECPDDFNIEYPEGKVRLLAGMKRDYVAEVALENINPDLTRTHLKNRVLEITCFKRNSES